MKWKLLLCWFFALLSGSALYAQAGLTVSPSKFYFHLGSGENGKQKIRLSNPLTTEVEVGVSFGDWRYDPYGNNYLQAPGSLPNSCATWIKVKPTSYFVLQPGEEKDLEMVLEVPPEVDSEIPVQTGMLYFTQLNPGTGDQDEMGAALTVTVRLGVKIYNSIFTEEAAEMEIVDFYALPPTEGNKIELFLENRGKIWTDGRVQWRLFHTGTGEESTFPDASFYTLPGDRRQIVLKLPDALEKGGYNLTAIVKYGEGETLKVAALDFLIEE